MDHWLVHTGIRHKGLGARALLDTAHWTTGSFTPESDTIDCCLLHIWRRRNETLAPAKRDMAQWSIGFCFRDRTQWSTESCTVAYEAMQHWLMFWWICLNGAQPPAQEDTTQSTIAPAHRDTTQWITCSCRARYDTMDHWLQLS